MKFFVPAAKDAEQAEQVYASVAKFNNAPTGKRRIYKLAWNHNTEDYECEVGKPMPAYFQTGDEPVMAILDCGGLYMICTPNRSGVHGEPIYAAASEVRNVIYFEEEK
jgi:hypothetical protein